MASGSTFALLRRLEIFQKNAEIMKDGAKYTLMFSQILTNVIKIWPEDRNYKIFNVTLMLVCTIHVLACFTFLTLSARDINTFTKAVAATEGATQTVGKLIALYHKSVELTALIKIIRYEFWPSDIMGSKTDRKIRKDANILSTLVLTTLVTSIAFLTLSTMLPLVKPGRQLPYSSWYPFDWTVTPAYQIIYSFQAYFNAFVDISAVLGYDNLFYSVCFNCTAQFRLLCEAVRLVGSGKEGEVIERLSKIPGIVEDTVVGDPERRLLVICVRHHQKLIKMSNDMNKTFGNGHLVQLFASAVGICTACYSVTIETNFNAIAYLIVLYFAHIYQLFTYCTVSNELSYWSSCVSIAAYESFWYKKEYADIKLCLWILMMRSQDTITMNAFGLFELNYASFVTVNIKYEVSTVTCKREHINNRPMMILQRIKEFKFYRDNCEIFEDGAKHIIIVPRILATLGNLWPQNKTRIIAFLFISISFIHELSLIANICVNISDLDSFLTSVSSLAIGVQSMSKGITFVYNSSQLKRLVEILLDEFWPSDLVGRETDAKIRKDSSKQLFVFIMQYVLSTAFVLMYIIIPIAKSGRQLPHSSWYPFDVLKSPAYEILILLQLLLTSYVFQNCVCSYDFLFCAFCGNMVAQFKLLCEVIKMIGSGMEGEIIRILLGIPGVRYRPVIEKIDEEERKLLVICINHHQKLIRMSQEINEIFGTGFLIQLSFIIMSICTTCYKLTTETNLNNLAFSISFCMAHIAQLLLYSAVSSELSHWSVYFAQEAFKSQWYEKEYTDIRKCLSIVIMRSQTAISMNTFGLYELNYASFLTAMRFTFSLYTFLNQMAK
ncbi:hypothetical protein Trydic_g3782 [Trypoxylus dichotomus]